MKKLALVTLPPIIFIVIILTMSFATDLLSAASDVEVILGILLMYAVFMGICIAIYKTIKKESKNGKS